ncbi:MAG: hypothetical protein GY771_05120 [bacterium]|nr:hypothetical protein [bacterium]
MAIPPPRLAGESALDAVVRKSRTDFGIPLIEKCLVYCPDAVGTFLFGKYGTEFEPVTCIAPTRVSLRAVFPPKTPVCFASMFTGAEPERHGITQYERPVLDCDTLFDALDRAGKKTAIIAVAGSSIDIIFRGRDVEYYSEEYDVDVTNRTLHILDTSDFDFILVYHQEYDDALHATSPESEHALAAFVNHISTFNELAKKANAKWSKYDRAYVFAPDHGAHYNRNEDRGDHGLDIDEDMNVEHFFGFAKSA